MGWAVKCHVEHVLKEEFCDKPGVEQGDFTMHPAGQKKMSRFCRQMIKPHTCALSTASSVRNSSQSPMFAHSLFSKVGNVAFPYFPSLM